MTGYDYLRWEKIILRNELKVKLKSYANFLATSSLHLTGNNTVMQIIIIKTRKTRETHTSRVFKNLLLETAL